MDTLAFLDEYDTKRFYRRIVCNEDATQIVKQLHDNKVTFSCEHKADAHAWPLVVFTVRANDSYAVHCLDDAVRLCD